MNITPEQFETLVEAAAKNIHIPCGHEEDFRHAPTLWKNLELQEQLRFRYDANSALAAILPLHRAMIIEECAKRCEANIPAIQCMSVDQEVTALTKAAARIRSLATQETKP